MRPNVHRYAIELRWAGRSAGDAWDYRSYSRDWTVHVPARAVLHGSADPVFHGDPARHNPEDLFVAAISACHMLTYLALCARHGIEIAHYLDAASGEMSVARGGSRFTSVLLRPTVGIVRERDRAAAERLHRTAHEECFIAASCRVPIRCDPQVVTMHAGGWR